MTQDALWKTNRKFIDKVATRYTGLQSKNVTLFNVDYGSYTVEEVQMKPKFIKNQELGERPVYYSNQIMLDNDEINLTEEGEEITLYNWGNAFIFKETNTIKLHLEGDFKQTKNKLLWLPVNKKYPIQIIKTKSYGKIDQPPTVKEWLMENHVINIKQKEYIQIVKGEYFICNHVDNLTFIEAVS